MIAPIGELFRPPTQPVRSPSRARAYATLYSPPPTQVSSSGANSIRPCCGGERRIMHSPKATKSNRQSFVSRIFIMPLLRCGRSSTLGPMDGVSSDLGDPVELFFGEHFFGDHPAPAAGVNLGKRQVFFQT